MSSATTTTTIAHPPARPRRSAQTRRPGALGADLLAAAAGVGLGITVALTVGAESLGSLSSPGGIATALGRLTGMVGAYLMVVLIVLVARVPALERVVGQDRLVRWHRRLGPWPLTLIASHGVLITVGYAQQADSGVAQQLWTLLATYPGVLAATVGFALLLVAGVSSYRKVRRRIAYENWWVIHLYTYIALALSFSHQLATGASFVGQPFARTFWTALWIGSAATVLLYRVALPLYRTFRHRLVVESVEYEAPGCVSLACRGHGLDRLGLRGGQFLQWRFLKRGLWWQAHPYSVSAMPERSRLRVTVKDLGDHSAALARIRPGTRIAIEGPYGVFTKEARRTNRVLLVGGGVGLTPLPALLGDLPERVDVEVMLRASTEADLVLRDEIEELAVQRGGRVHELVGPRSEARLDSEALLELVPDLGRRDVYVCGPQGFGDAIVSAARAAGVSGDRIHREQFEL